MKYFFILLPLFLSSFIYCQNTEAYVTYGTQFLNYSNSVDGEFEDLGKKFEGQWPINYDKPGRLAVPSGKNSFLSSRGSITVGYLARKGKHSFGGLFLFEKQKMSHTTNQFTGGTIGIDVNTGEVIEMLEFELTNQLAWSDSAIKNFHLAARYDFSWMIKEKIKLYSGASLGVGIRKSNTIYYDVDSIQDQYPDEVLESFYRDKSTDLGYHFHLNALGIRYGTVWAIVAELGIGHRGYVNLGINHQLFASEKWDAKREAKGKK